MTNGFRIALIKIYILNYYNYGICKVLINSVLVESLTAVGLCNSYDILKQNNVFIVESDYFSDCEWWDYFDFNLLG